MKSYGSVILACLKIIIDIELSGRYQEYQA